jgi:Tol biopolymer transport system component
MRRFLIAISIIGALLAFAAGVTAQVGAEVALRTAVEKETVKGDLKGAIEQYKKLAQGKDRGVAARALVRMGQCYEKLGDAEAANAYNRVVRDFADQKEAAAEARKLLEAKARPAESGIVVRQVVNDASNRQYGPGISQDGRYIAFSVPRGPGIYDLTTGKVTNLTLQGSPSGSVSNTIISPDGKSIAYTKAESPASNVLYVIGTDGSNPRLLAGDKDVSVIPWSWAPDGKVIVAGRFSREKGRQVALVSVADGSSRIIASNAMNGRISPDGKYIAMVRGQGAYGELVVVGVEGGNESVIVGGRNRDPLWAPDGKRILVVSDRNGEQDLWSVRIENGTAAGAPEYVHANVDSLLGATPSGEYYYHVNSRIIDLYLADMDPKTGSLRSQPRRITNQDFNYGAAWSPDGQHLAYYVFRGSGAARRGQAIMIRSAKTGEVREVAAKEQFASATRMPLWFPDSRSLLVYTFDEKLRRLDVQTGEVQALPDEAKIPHYQDGANTAARGTAVLLAPDGRSVYYLVRDREASATRFIRRALEGGPETEVCRIQTDAVRGFSLSPDGAQMVFVADGLPLTAGNRATVWTVPTSGGTPKEFYRAPATWSYPSNPWPHQPLWSKDGQRVFVIFGWDGGDVFAFPRDGGEPKPQGFGLHQKACLDLSPDGSQMVFADEQWSNQLWMIKNLFPEPKPAR